MTNALPALVDTTATRAALHRVAEDVLAAEQMAAIGTIRLAVVPGGFATRWFPRPDGEQQRIRVENGDLIRETSSDADRQPIAPAVDPSAAAVLNAWYELGADLLGAIVADRGAAATDVVLWPEHFDLATTVDVAEGRKINLGFSPGDDFCAQPYVYAGPWETQSGPFWNAPFGAYRTYSEILGDDARSTAMAFLHEALDVVASAASG